MPPYPQQQQPGKKPKVAKPSRPFLNGPNPTERMGWGNIMIASIPGISLLMYLIISVGCLSNPVLNSVYLVSLERPENATGGAITVKASYFGLCLKSEEFEEKCVASQPNIDSLVIAKEILPEEWVDRNNNNKDDIKAYEASLKIIQLGREMQAGIFVPIFTVAGVGFALGCFSLAIITLKVKRRLKRSPNPFGAWMTMREETSYIFMRRGTLTLLWGSVAVSLMASLGTTQTAGAIRYAASNVLGEPVEGLKIKEGMVLQGLQWSTSILGMTHAILFAWSHKTTVDQIDPEAMAQFREEQRSKARAERRGGPAGYGGGGYTGGGYPPKEDYQSERAMSIDSRISSSPR